MTKGKKAAVGAGIGIAVAVTLIWAFRARAEPDKAILEGTVTDIYSTEPIKDILVSCNGYTGETNGNYRIINIEPGTYPVTFTDPLGRYAPLTV